MDTGKPKLLDQMKNVIDFIRAGRKIEYENILKIQGYNIDQHSGHGDMLLFETPACMNIFAFLFHTVYNFETLYN